MCGYNTALLAHRLGAHHVVSVEIDETLAGHAQRGVTAAGYAAVTVLTGDGSLGHREQAPYDRVLCTASVQQVPYAWVLQTRPGGRILTPWANAYFDGGLLALEPLGDGSATDRIVGKAWFMWLRDQRVSRVSVSRFVRDNQHAEVSATEVHPFKVAGDYDAQLAVSLRVPDCRHLYWRPDHNDGHCTLWLIDPGSGAWASLRHHPKSHGPYEVRQHGPRRLWDEIEAAYLWWQDAGAPTATEWHLHRHPGHPASRTQRHRRKADIAWCDTPAPRTMTGSPLRAWEGTCRFMGIRTSSITSPGRSRGVLRRCATTPAGWTPERGRCGGSRWPQTGLGRP
ncbi:MAG: hypothetical protein ACRDRE_10110 [Pseudonocardiaceae bacterium]